MEAFTRAPFTLVLLSLCNQLSVNFQEESLIVLLCWLMERAGNGFTRLPSPHPTQPSHVSLQAINSASKPRAAAIPKHHLMLSGCLRMQAKICLFCKGCLFISGRCWNNQRHLQHRLQHQQVNLCCKVLSAEDKNASVIFIIILH